ncbi:MAG TPA: adenylate/guanylate cyclase domain-containing protein [Gaiellaceae bacterium]
MGADPDRPVEERKVVSVLFADLVGFTARSERADPEDVRELLRPYHSRAKHEIERLGGTVEKFVGDAVMGVFGAPTAHEDDAVRAVTAALGIVDAIAELNEARPGTGLALRAAVNTGEAIVDLSAHPERGEIMVTGDVVNTAARLQEVAPLDGVVVGELTYRTTRDSIEYEQLEPASLKGKAEPVGVWRATARRGVERRTPPVAFVGRDEDLALLEHAFTRTLRERSIQLVTVVGEPGVGKSRLVREFRSLVERRPEEVAWRQGRCLPYGEGITFWALGEIVKTHAGILESDDSTHAAEKLRAAIEVVSAESGEREWLATRLAPLAGAQLAAGAEPAERSESFTGWRRFFEAVAAERPLVLVVEDLHWADPALLEFVDHLVDWSTGVAILVISTARPELFERKPGWGGGKRNSTTISLSPLTSEETARLISALLPQAVLPAETQVALLERAGGNPLYAEEFVRMLADRGIVGGRGAVVESEILVPETVQALISARLDTLAPDRKALLQEAAVVGKVFWDGALASMAGADEESVAESLHDLVQKELVRPIRGSSVEGEAEYVFWHVLIRDVAYGQIPRLARVRKHEAAAAWMERLAGDGSDKAEILAYHYGQALELARAAGAVEEGERLETPAGRFLVLAGDRAVQLDVAKAEGYYRRALELLPDGHPNRAEVIAKAAETAWLAGRLLEAERGYEEAIADARRQENVLRAGEVMVDLVASLRDRGETRRARALLDDAVALLEREPPGRELALAYLNVARDDAVSGRARDCLESSARAIRLLERLGMRDHAARTLQFRGGARIDLGDLEGLDDLRESLRLSLELGLGYYTVNAYGNLAENVWQIEGPAAALDLYRAGIDFGERRGIAFKTRWVEGEMLWSLFDLGGWDELLERAERLIRSDEAHGGSQVGIMALTYRARVLVLRGQTAEAASSRERFLAAARQSGDRQVLVPALAVAGLIGLASGDVRGAVELIDELEGSTRDYAGWRSHELADALRVCSRAGELELGRRLLEGGAEFVPRDRHEALTARAELAEGRGESERAAELYAEAAERWGEFGHALERGLTLLGRGRCLAALGWTDEATAPLREADAAFRHLGAAPLLGETAALLGAAA